MKKTLLALGAALLLLALVFVIQDYREKAAARPRFAFDTASAGSVTRLNVVYQGEAITVTRQGKGAAARWKTGAEGFPADTARLRTVLYSLIRVQTRERVSTGGDSARLAEYGLAPGDAKRVEWTLEDGARFTILLGNTSGTDYNSTYWKFADKPEVYRTPGNFTNNISVQANDWRDRNLFPLFTHEQVRSVEVQWIDSLGKNVHYRLDKVGDSAAKMVLPRETPVPAKNAMAIFVQTPQFVIDDFALPEDPNIGAAALDTPAVVVRTTLRDGEVYTITAGRAFDGMHYAKHPGLPGAVIKIAAWRLNFFRKTPDQLLLPPPVDTPDEEVHGPDDGHGH